MLLQSTGRAAEKNEVETLRQGGGQKYWPVEQHGVNGWALAGQWPV